MMDQQPRTRSGKTRRDVRGMVFFESHVTFLTDTQTVDVRWPLGSTCTDVICFGDRYLLIDPDLAKRVGAVLMQNDTKYYCRQINKRNTCSLQQLKKIVVGFVRNRPAADCFRNIKFITSPAKFRFEWESCCSLLSTLLDHEPRAAHAEEKYIQNLVLKMQKSIVLPPTKWLYESFFDDCGDQTYGAFNWTEHEFAKTVFDVFLNHNIRHLKKGAFTYDDEFYKNFEDLFKYMFVKFLHRMQTKFWKTCVQTDMEGQRTLNVSGEPMRSSTTPRDREFLHKGVQTADIFRKNKWKHIQDIHIPMCIRHALASPTDEISVKYGPAMNDNVARMQLAVFMVGVEKATGVDVFTAFDLSKLNEQPYMHA